MKLLQPDHAMKFSDGGTSEKHVSSDHPASPVFDELSAVGVAGAMHDLGNLIQVASSAIALIARQPDMPTARSSRMLAQARTCLDRAGTLTRRHLGLIRGHGQPVATDCSVAACLDDVATLVEAMGEPGLVLDLEVEPDLPPVACDPIGLQNAVLNLVFNARDAMLGRGRVAVSARTRSARFEGTVEIRVADHGVGMSPATIGRALAPFFTTKSDGMGGVGLPMVERFVRSAGGDLEIESEPRIGTTVTLRLPAASLDPRPVPSAQESAL